MFSCLCWTVEIAYLISHTLMPSTVPGGEVELSYSAFFKKKIVMGSIAGSIESYLKWNWQARHHKA